MTNTIKPEICIKTKGISGTEIYINGEKLEGVTGFRFSQSFKENSGLPTLQIDLKATNVTLETEMLPALPEPFANFYASKAKLVEAGMATPEQLESM